MIFQMNLDQPNRQTAPMQLSTVTELNTVKELTLTAELPLNLRLFWARRSMKFRMEAELGTNPLRFAPVTVQVTLKSQIRVEERSGADGSLRVTAALCSPAADCAFEVRVLSSEQVEADLPTSSCWTTLLQYWNLGDACAIGKRALQTLLENSLRQAFESSNPDRPIYAASINASDQNAAELGAMRAGRFHFADHDDECSSLLGNILNQDHSIEVVPPFFDTPAWKSRADLLPAMEPFCNHAGQIVLQVPGAEAAYIDSLFVLSACRDLLGMPAAPLRICAPGSVLPCDLLSVWFDIPKERSGSYKAIARQISITVQTFLRKELPRQHFEADRPGGGTGYDYAGFARSVLVYECAQPFAGRARGDVISDPMSPECVARILWSAEEKLPARLEQAHADLRRAGKPLLIGQYQPKPLHWFTALVRNHIGPLQSLLQVEAEVFNTIYMLSVQAGLLRSQENPPVAIARFSREVVPCVARRLRRALAGQDCSDLALPLLCEVTQTIANAMAAEHGTARKVA